MTDAEHTGDDTRAQEDRDTARTPERSPDDSDATPDDSGATPDDSAATPDEHAERAPAGDAGVTPGRTGLLLDVMLGKLATYLRMCGYDAAYAGTRGAERDDDAAAIAETEGRVLVTRDRDLAARVEPSVLLSSRDVVEQLRELADAGFELELAETPTHCSACNGRLEPVDRTEPTPDYAPPTHDQQVWRCRDCGQHFWKGSHWDDVGDTLAAL